MSTSFSTTEYALIADLLCDHTNGLTVDASTGEKWERPGAFFLVANEKNPVVTFDQWRADVPEVRAYVAEKLDEYALTERGNYDAWGIYLSDDGHTVMIDAVTAYNGHATLTQALQAGRDNNQECIGVIEDGHYLASLAL